MTFLNCLFTLTFIMTAECKWRLIETGVKKTNLTILNYNTYTMQNLEQPQIRKLDQTTWTTMIIMVCITVCEDEDKEISWATKKSYYYLWKFWFWNWYHFCRHYGIQNISIWLPCPWAVEKGVNHFLYCSAWPSLPAQLKSWPKLNTKIGLHTHPPHPPHPPQTFWRVLCIAGAQDLVCWLPID